MSKLKKVLDIASTVMLVLFVAFVILLVGVRLFGIEPHIVLSGSMEPCDPESTEARSCCDFFSRT